MTTKSRRTRKAASDGAELERRKELSALVSFHEPPHVRARFLAWKCWNPQSRPADWLKAFALPGDFEHSVAAHVSDNRLRQYDIGDFEDMCEFVAHQIPKRGIARLDAVGDILIHDIEVARRLRRPVPAGRSSVAFIAERRQRTLPQLAAALRHIAEVIHARFPARGNILVGNSPIAELELVACTAVWSTQDWLWQATPFVWWMCDRSIIKPAGVHRDLQGDLEAVLRIFSDELPVAAWRPTAQRAEYALARDLPARLLALGSAIDQANGGLWIAGTSSALDQTQPRTGTGETVEQPDKRRKPDGWTKRELVDQAREFTSFSATGFDRIREAAGVKRSPKGGLGQQRRFGTSELRQMIDAVEASSVRNRSKIAEAWRGLLAD